MPTGQGSPWGRGLMPREHPAALCSFGLQTPKGKSSPVRHMTGREICSLRIYRNLTLCSLERFREEIIPGGWLSRVRPLPVGHGAGQTALAGRGNSAFMWQHRLLLFKLMLQPCDSPPPWEIVKAQSDAGGPTQSYRFDGFNSLLSCQPYLSLRLSSHLQNTEFAASSFSSWAADTHRYPLHPVMLHAKKSHQPHSLNWSFIWGNTGFPKCTALPQEQRHHANTELWEADKHSSCSTNRDQAIRSGSKLSATQPKHLSKRDQASPPVLHPTDPEGAVRRQPSLGTELVWMWTGEIGGPTAQQGFSIHSYCSAVWPAPHTLLKLSVGSTRVNCIMGQPQLQQHLPPCTSSKQENYQSSLRPLLCLLQK